MRARSSRVGIERCGYRLRQTHTTRHDEKTRGLLPTIAVEAANRAPHNLETGVSHPQQLHYVGDTCWIRLGDSIFQAFLAETQAFAALVVDSQVLLGFRIVDDHLLLNLSLKDDRGNHLLTVNRNELVVVTTQWDIAFEGTRS